MNCLVPTINRTNARSSDSAVFPNLHFVPWFRQCAKKLSLTSCFAVWAVVADIWLTCSSLLALGASQIASKLPLASFGVRCSPRFNCCTPIHNKMNEACSSSDFFEYGLLKIISQYCLNFTQRIDVFLISTIESTTLHTTTHTISCSRSCHLSRVKMWPNRNWSRHLVQLKYERPKRDG